MSDVDAKTVRLVVSLACCAAGIAWKLSFEWLRHRSYLKHIRSGPAPSTQHLAWAGTLGLFVFAIGAVAANSLLKTK